MIPIELEKECEDIQRRVDAMSDDYIRSIGTTRDTLIRDMQHFAGVRYYSNLETPSADKGKILNMSDSTPNICVACKKEMPVINEGLWMFRNGPFSLIVRLITKNEKSQVESHQICLSCIKSIVNKMEQPT